MMEKIISLFARNYDGDHLVRDEIVAGAEWVVAGEGTATRKMDGTSCLVRDGRLYKRYDAKAWPTPPVGWEQAQDRDPVSGHWPGWVPIGDGPDDRYHREAWALYQSDFGEGTFELLGPKVQGNPEGMTEHRLVRHGGWVLSDVPRDFEGLRAYLADAGIEGIVWHHPDQRMVKIKARDFGIKRP